MDEKTKSPVAYFIGLLMYLVLSVSVAEETKYL